MANWYYYDNNGNKVGPIASAALKSLAQQGLITTNTTVENEQGKSVRAGDVNGLEFPPSSPPSVPTSTSPSKDPFATVTGVGSILKIYDDKIILQREAQGSKTLYFTRVTSTQYSAGKAGLPGFLQFTFAGSKDMSGVGVQAVIEAMGDENSFVFLGFQNILVSAIRDYIDAKIGGADSTNEQAVLSSVFANYAKDCEKLHYSVRGKDGATLQVYGDRIIMNNAVKYYVEFCTVTSVPSLSKDSPNQIQLQCAFPFKPESNGKLEIFGGKFDSSQSKEVNDISSFLQNTVGLSIQQATGCAVLILLAAIGLLGSGLGCSCLFASLLF